MNLYEINSKIYECIDHETGEIINDELLTKLEILKDEKIENICLYIKNLEAENLALKNEIDFFTERKKKNENKIKRLSEYVNNILNGENFKTSKVVVNYRKSKSVETNESFINWALENEPHLLIYKEPTPNKTEIKRLLENGVDLKHAKIVEKNNMKIK